MNMSGSNFLLSIKTDVFQTNLEIEGEFKFLNVWKKILVQAKL